METALTLALVLLFAVITMVRLADDTLVVSHRIKGVGSRGRASKLGYEKALPGRLGAA